MLSLALLPLQRVRVMPSLRGPVSVSVWTSGAGGTDATAGWMGSVCLSAVHSAVTVVHGVSHWRVRRSPCTPLHSHPPPESPAPHCGPMCNGPIMAQRGDKSGPTNRRTQRAVGKQKQKTSKNNAHAIEDKGSAHRRGEEANMGITHLYTNEHVISWSYFDANAKLFVRYM